MIVYSLIKNFESRLFCRLRYELVKHKFKSSGKRGFIGANVTLKNISRFEVGDNFSIHCNSYIDAVGGIVIGDNVSIAHNSSLVSFEHTYDNLAIPIKYNQLALKEISIANDVWIGCGVRVLAGTKIKSRSVVAANSVTKGELLNSGIYAGLPARLKKGFD
ncbi:acyltransferase [Pseudoalteromonas porphyrae]|uniref:acyltransferase n=1 Tax=Pseudoalteromonas porphyrae TaxID=187330 RepID=UPI0006BA85A9|nr:acyltransferase [Pseudoalteromonas porphyrae]